MSLRAYSFLGLFSCALAGLTMGCVASPDNEAGVDDGEVATSEQAVSDAKIALKPVSKQLAKEWLRWVMDVPWSTGPVNDLTGAACAEGQDGPVWFLAGTPGGDATRSCTIPEGKTLFFPLINIWWVFAPQWYPDQASIDADLPGISEYFDSERAAICELTVKVDGVDIAGDIEDADGKTWVKAMNLFDVELNADNYISAYGVSGGEYSAVTAGWFAKIKPLSPGDHVLEFGGQQCYPDGSTWAVSATYQLHVED